eukprot:357961-Chlamydomonas_euryale.AAC.3
MSTRHAHKLHTQGLPCSGGSGGSSARQRRRSSRTDGRPRGGTAAASKSGIGGGDTRGSAGGGGEGGTCAADVLTPGPKEVLIRILSFVSAEDLGCAAAACRALHTAAREDVLWRRLFCARCGGLRVCACDVGEERASARARRRRLECSACGGGPTRVCMHA